jgi:hypothetical protein
LQNEVIARKAHERKRIGIGRKMSSINMETSLNDLGFWPPDAVQRLAQVWITTAGQVVAALASGGINPLASQSGLSSNEVEHLIKLTEQALPADQVEQLSKPVDTKQMGLGAFEPPQAPERDNSEEE